MKRPIPFDFNGGKTGVLLIHGISGSPSEMRPLGEFLHQKGYTVKGVLLAGHGTKPEDMEKKTKEDWIQSAADAFFELSRSCKQVFVGGFSMGGLIALHLAARLPVAGFVSMCTPIFTQDRRIRFARFASHFLKFQKKTLIRDESIEKYYACYDRTPMRSFGELWDLITLVKQEIPNVKAPALVMQSEKDETVCPESGTYVYQHLGSNDKQLKWYANSGHILPLDADQEAVWSDFVMFLKANELRV